MLSKDTIKSITSYEQYLINESSPEIEIRTFLEDIHIFFVYYTLPEKSFRVLYNFEFYRHEPEHGSLLTINKNPSVINN